MFHQQSSLNRRYQIRHNSLVQRIKWLVDAWQKTHIHLQQPKKKNVKDKQKLNITWWARHIRSRSCLCKNLETTSGPKVNDTPRSFSPQPLTSWIYSFKLVKITQLLQFLIRNKVKIKITKFYFVRIRP